MAVADHRLIGQELEINDSIPVVLAVENDGHFLHPSGLSQSQHGEQFVQRPEAAWEANDRFGAEEKMHLPDGEVVELKTQARCDVGVGRLLEGKRNVERH